MQITLNIYFYINILLININKVTEFFKKYLNHIIFVYASKVFLYILVIMIETILLSLFFFIIFN